MLFSLVVKLSLKSAKGSKTRYVCTYNRSYVYVLGTFYPLRDRLSQRRRNLICLSILEYESGQVLE